MADFFGAYAADLPVAYKAPPPVEPGRFTVWVEGGAIWTGGDPVCPGFLPQRFHDGREHRFDSRHFRSEPQNWLGSGNRLRL